MSSFIHPENTMCHYYQLPVHHNKANHVTHSAAYNVTVTVCVRVRVLMFYCIPTNAYHAGYKMAEEMCYYIQSMQLYGSTSLVI